MTAAFAANPSTKFPESPFAPAAFPNPTLLIAEHYCVACRTPFVTPYPLDESGRCGLCRAGLQGFDAVYSYGSYEGALRKLIHLFKYSGVEPLAAPFGQLLAQVLPREQRFDVIVPMPLHWRKRWQRGFNQAELLAKEISRRWNVPVERAVRRRRGSVAQAGLSNAQRRKNVAHVFEARKASHWKVNECCWWMTFSPRAPRPAPAPGFETGRGCACHSACAGAYGSQSRNSRIKRFKSSNCCDWGVNRL